MPARSPTCLVTKLLQLETFPPGSWRRETKWGPNQDFGPQRVGTSGRAGPVVGPVVDPEVGPEVGPAADSGVDPEADSAVDRQRRRRS